MKPKTATGARTFDRPRVLLVGPSPFSTGGIAAFSSALARGIEDVADCKPLAFRKLYPSFTRAGSNGGGVANDGLLVPWSPASWRASDREAAKFAPDQAIIQWWHPSLGPSLGFIARRLRKRNCRVVFVCHNAEPHEPFPASKLLTRRALEHASELVALSDYVGARIANLYERSVTVLPFPAILSATGQESTSLSGTPVILFFGYVRPYKGLEDLFRAIPAIRASHPAAKLIVAGPFIEPVERYRALAMELGIGDAVDLRPGFVPDADVVALLRSSDVLALPYRSASQSGIVPLARSLGARIVATPVGGLAEQQDVVFVPARNPDALARGIEQALAMPKPEPWNPGWDAWRDFVSRGFAQARPSAARTFEEKNRYGATA